MNGGHTDNVVIITGAAQGLGRAHAELLAERGYHVCVTDVETPEMVADAIEAAGGAASAHRLDVTNPDMWRVAARDASEFGTVKALVNNAGVNDRASVEAETSDGWNHVIAVNLTGVFNGLNVIGPVLRDNGGGAIVTIVSSASLTLTRGAAYTASKWGARGLTKTAAMEFAPWGVRVNSVHPGLIDTPLTSEDATFEQSFLKSVPMQRLGDSREIASATAFLLSDEASYVTGADISVDGGFASSGITWRILGDLKP